MARRVSSHHRLLPIMISAISLILSPAVCGQGGGISGGAGGQEKIGGPHHPHRLIVKYRSRTPPDLRRSMREALATPLIHKYSLVPGLECVEARDVPAALRVLRAHPLVEFAEPDYAIHTLTTPNDPDFPQSWALHNQAQTGGLMDADIDAPEAWSLFIGSPSFVIAVMDTGVQWTHPDLAGNIWTNPGEIPGNFLDDDGNGYIDDIHGWDFVDNDNDPDDPQGHGTHVAGIIGASGNNGIGTAGVNWRCDLMPLRIIGPLGGFTSDAIRAMEYAADKRVRVSNNSWGTTGFSQALYDAISAAQSIDHIYVAAAGNDSVDNDLIPTYPASYDLDNIIAVAASTHLDQFASFSNRGAFSVDLAAPGENIYSALSGDTYGFLSGTSMAAPHVAGAVALLTASQPDWNYSQIRDHLLAAVDPLPSLRGQVVSGGRLNLRQALAFTTPQPPVADADGPRLVMDLDENGFETITLSGGNSFDLDGVIVSYAWSNGPLNLGSAPTLATTLSVGVHSITLTVVDDDGFTDSDQAVITVAPPPPPPLAQDGFESNNPTGGAGLWLGGWDINAGGALSNRDEPHSGAQHLHIHGKNTIIRRFVDLAGATGVHLRFWLKARGFSGPDKALVTVTTDGGAPLVVQRFGLNISDNSYRLYDLDLSGILMTDGLEIAFTTFLASGSIWLDDIEFIGIPFTPVPLPPHAEAGPDLIVIDADQNGRETITLDGSASFDPDGVIASYAWSAGSTLLGASPILPVDFPLGTFTITITVTDDSGLTASDSLTVTVDPLPIVAGDDFESGDFTGGFGLWIGDWITSGEVRIRANRDGPHSGAFHVRLRKQDTSIRRILNLSAISSPHLRFWGKSRSFQEVDSISVRFSPDGMNFTTLLTLTSASSDDLYHSYDLDLTGLPLSETSHIEFFSDMGNGEFFVDDLEIVLPEG